MSKREVRIDNTLCEGSDPVGTYSGNIVAPEVCVHCGAYLNECEPVDEDIRSEVLYKYTNFGIDTLNDLERIVLEGCCQECYDYLEEWGCP